MECIVCGREAGYHRAVVDTYDERLVGGLCRECEREEFGRVLERARFADRSGCLLCDRDGQVAIPVWRPTARRTAGGDVVSEVAYRVDRETARLCDEHLADVAGHYPISRPRAATPEHR